MCCIGVTITDENVHVGGRFGWLARLLRKYHLVNYTVSVTWFESGPKEE